MSKILAHLKCFFALIPVGLFALITAPFVYPLAYLWQKYIGKFNPFWFWLDDEIQGSKDWLIYCNGDITNFKYLYFWHSFRNSMWNLKELIKPENARLHCVWNKEEIVEVKKDNLMRDGEKVSIYENCIEMACFKWIDKWNNEGWQVNRGVKISKKYSTIGTSELWYKANNKLYYRYSTAREYKIFGKLFYFTFVMGASEKRYLLICKLNVR